MLGSLSQGLARLSVVQDTRAARARSVLAQCDPTVNTPSALSPVNLPAAETPPKFPRSMSTSSLLVSGNSASFLHPFLTASVITCYTVMMSEMLRPRGHGVEATFCCLGLIVVGLGLMKYWSYTHVSWPHVLHRLFAPVNLIN